MKTMLLVLICALVLLAQPAGANPQSSEPVKHGGKIEAVGPRGKVTIPDNAERHDVSGRTIIPGLVNTHGHVGETRGMQAGPQYYTRDNVLRQLRVYARYGITTVWSLGGEQEPAYRARDAQNTASLNRARIHLAGTVIVGKTADEVYVLFNNNRWSRTPRGEILAQAPVNAAALRQKLDESGVPTG